MKYIGYIVKMKYYGKVMKNKRKWIIPFLYILPKIQTRTSMEWWWWRGRRHWVKFVPNITKWMYVHLSTYNAISFGMWKGLLKFCEKHKGNVEYKLSGRESGKNSFLDKMIRLRNDSCEQILFLKLIWWVFVFIISSIFFFVYYCFFWWCFYPFMCVLVILNIAICVSYVFICVPFLTLKL